MDKEALAKTGGGIESSKLIEDHWHNSFDVITDMVSLHDAGHKILKVNKAFTDALHLDREDIIGKQCCEIIHKTKEPIHNCPCKHALELKKTVIREIYEPVLDLHLEVTAYPVFDEKNNLKGMLHFMKNITERKLAEEALSHSEKRHQVIFDQFMKNITERRQVEESLRKERKALRDIASSLAEGIYVMNKEGNVIFMNPEAERLLGWTMSELSNRNIHDSVHCMKTDGSPLPFKECWMYKVIENGVRFVSSDEVFVRKDGTVFPVSVTCSPVIEDGQAIGSVTAFRDITGRKNIEKERENLIFELSIANKELEREIAERRNAEEHLRQSEERFRLAMLGATDGLWDRDLRTDEIYYSPRWKSMLGYADEELPNHIDTWKSLLHPDDRETTLALVRDFAEGRADKYEVEFRLRHKDGHYVDILSRGSLLSDAGGKALRLVGTHVDITYRKQAEEQLRITHEQLELRVLARTLELNRSNEQLRNLAAHLQSVREEERMKIAREIHDELGQALSAQKMELSWFREQYGDHKPIFDKAGAMLNALNETIRSIRRICTELRPSILDDFGLLDAMQWHAAEFQKRTRIECAVDSVPEHIELDKERSTALFRIFQEALTNVLKHARATKVAARLTKGDNDITLDVIDNGKGLTDEQLSKPQAFGLIVMRERVYPWGGRVEITGYKNKGTIVKVSIPDSAPPQKKKQSNLHQ